MNRYSIYIQYILASVVALCNVYYTKEDCCFVTSSKVWSLYGSTI